MIVNCQILISINSNHFINAFQTPLLVDKIVLVVLWDRNFDPAHKGTDILDGQYSISKYMFEKFQVGKRLERSLQWFCDNFRIVDLKYFLRQHIENATEKRIL